MSRFIKLTSGSNISCFAKFAYRSVTKRAPRCHSRIPRIGLHFLPKNQPSLGRKNDLLVGSPLFSSGTEGTHGQAEK
ncbi:MAG TPA: hypothetical protein VGC99_01745 [Candidatus Tectomicrobia bacterium]